MIDTEKLQIDKVYSENIKNQLIEDISRIINHNWEQNVNLNKTFTITKKASDGSLKDGVRIIINFFEI